MLLTHICSDYPVIIGGALVSILIRIKFSYAVSAVSEDPGQPPQSMASDLGMHPVPVFCVFALFSVIVPFFRSRMEHIYYVHILHIMLGLRIMRRI